MSPDPNAGVSRATQPMESQPAKYIVLLVAVVALVRVGQLLVHLPIRAPYQFDYEEGNILNALLRITQGATPYPDPHALPNIINPYGPAAYYLLVIPVKLFGLAFLYPRAMVLGCTLLIALLIAVELRRATGSVALAFSLAVVFLSVPNIQDWAWLLRVDLLGIAFTAAGLVVFTSRSEFDVTGETPVPRRQRHTVETRRLSWCAALFAAALLVKPTLVAAPAACFFHLIAKRRWADVAKLTGITVVLYSLVMGFFAAVTHGAVITDVFFSHPDPFSFQFYTEGLTLMFVASWPLVLLAVVGIARHRSSPAALWLVFATLTAITAGKLGSNQNHFLEWNAALCLAGGLGLHELTKAGTRRVALVLTAAAVVVTGLVISRQPEPLSNVNLNRGCFEAYDWVRTQAGPNVLSENVGALVLGNKRVWVSNPFVLAQLVERAGWSDAELVEMARNRRFDAMFMGMNYGDIPFYLAQGTDRFSPGLLRAVQENYEAQPGFVCRDMAVLFTPRKSAAIQSK